MAAAGCAVPDPAAVTARAWHPPAPAVAVSPVACGRLPDGQEGLEYRFANHGQVPAAPMVSVTFTSGSAPNGSGVAGQGATGLLVPTLPGGTGTGFADAPPGLQFDGCVITSWQVVVLTGPAYKGGTVPP
jgi:hypothetical protein